MLLNFYPLFKSFKHLIFQQLQLVLYLSAKSSLEKVRLVKISYPSFHAQIICLSCNGYEKWVLAHFENNLDFKATHEFFLDFKSTWNQPWLKKKTVLTHFQNSLDFKATWIFHRFTMSHSRVLAHFVSHKGYAKSTQLNLSVATDNLFFLFLTLQNQIEDNNWKNSDASEKFWGKQIWKFSEATDTRK